MCLNCGCKMYDDDMGDAANITTKTVAAAAKASGQTPAEAMREMRSALDDLLAAPPPAKPD